MPTLYHYTNAIGLKGIVQSKTIWATDYRFLNDASEFNFGLKIVASAITKYHHEIERVSEDVISFLEALKQLIERSGVCAFVASLSTEGDLLSQWRGYNGGKGYSIGFDYDWLNNNAKAQDFSLIKVIYDADEQQASAEAQARELKGLVELFGGDDILVREMVRKWWVQALKVALAFKDPHFREESEYRLAYVATNWPGSVQTRTTAAGIVPYLPYKFNEVIIRNRALHPSNYGVQEIIVGPALKDQQKISVDALLASQHMRLAILKSQIPFVAD